MSALDLNALLGTSFVGMTVGEILSALLTLIVCLIVIKAVLKLTSRLLSRSKLDARVQKYIQTGIKLVLYIITVVIVAERLDVNMTSLVALLSVGSLGITLAAEDILGNVGGVIFIIINVISIRISVIKETYHLILGFNRRFRLPSKSVFSHKVTTSFYPRPLGSLLSQI